MLRHRRFRNICVCIILILSFIMMTGCGRVKFTTGLGKSTFAKINGEKVDMSIAMLLLGEFKYSYENIFDANVWSEPIGSVTAEEYVKNSVRDTIEQVMCLNQMAADAGVSLTEDETQKIKEAAALYCSELPADTVEEGVIDCDTVEEYYGMLRLAEKVFYSVTDDIDTEVSTDEARIINVQYIFLSTVSYDEDNNPVSVSQAEKKSKEKLAQSLLEQIINGSDFVTLAKDNSDDSCYTLEFGRGEYQKQFEDAAFALEMGTVSDVVETDIGYYIIKCTNDNVESDYDKQSREIIFSRRMESFSGYYGEFTDGVSAEFNQGFWNKVPMDEVKSGSGRLYDIYEDIFVSTQ